MKVDSPNDPDDNAPDHDVSPLGSVQWTEADTVGSSTSMLDFMSLAKVLDQQQQQQQHHQEPSEVCNINEHGNNDDTLPTAPVYIEVGAPVVKRYNFMVVGVSGSGKSTFCSRLLQRYFPQFSLVTEHEPTTLDGEPTTTITERARCERIQGNTRIIFTIVDSPGYGDSIDNHQDRFLPIENYIRQQNQLYEVNEEYRRLNNQSNDSRIHCCFYFLMPHRVTALDGRFMKRLQTMVPLVPIIAKADTYTTQEIGAQLCNLERVLQDYKISIFDFQENGINQDWKKSNNTNTGTAKDTTSKEENQVVDTDASIVICPPAYIPASSSNNNNETTVRPEIPNVFAVISGNRQYMWGVAREDDPRHSDTPRLHSVLFQNRHLQSLSRLQECANNMHEIWHKENQKRILAEQQLKTSESQKKKTMAYEERLQICIVLILIFFACLVLWLTSVHDSTPEPQIHATAWRHRGF